MTTNQLPTRKEYEDEIARLQELNRKLIDSYGELNVAFLIKQVEKMLLEQKLTNEELAQVRKYSQSQTARVKELEGQLLKERDERKAADERILKRFDSSTNGRKP